MSTRLYPIYQKGNPQLRIYLPNFWMKIVRPEEKLPPNFVLFRTSVQMTNHDVKNYLEKIYKIQIAEVVTTIRMGKTRRSPKNYIVKDDDYKEALVKLPKGHTFKYPDIMKDVDKEEVKMQEEVKLLKEDYKKFLGKTSSCPATNNHCNVLNWII